MRQQEALCVLVRRHQGYFNFLVECKLNSDETLTKKKARSLAIRDLVGQYQGEYLKLRGKSLKGVL